MQVRRKKINFKRMRPRRRRDRRKPTTKSAKECDAFLFFISSSLCLVFRGLSSHQKRRRKAETFLSLRFKIHDSKSHAREMIQSPPTLLRAPRTFAKLYEEKRRDKTHPRRRWTTLLSFSGTPSSSLLCVNLWLIWLSDFFWGGRSESNTTSQIYKKYIQVFGDDDDDDDEQTRQSSLDFSHYYY
jgi:hypothetical protein